MSLSAPTVTVEFFGVPRLRAGRASLTLEAGTIAEALATIAKACPQLHGLTQADGRLNPHYLLSLNGRGFDCDPDQALRPDDRILLMSADAGG